MEVRQVAVPGVEGPFTVLPGHADLLSNLTIGPLTAVLLNGERHSVAVNGGVARVLNSPPPGTAHVLILTQTAEMNTEIDLERAQAARERAQQRLREASKRPSGGPPTSGAMDVSPVSGLRQEAARRDGGAATSGTGTIDVARAEAALRRALLRIRIRQGIGSKAAPPKSASQ